METIPQIPRPAEWLGYFYGHDLSFLDAEVLMMHKISDPLIKKESALMRTKWFDCRRMHPTKATYYLAHCYNKAYQDCMKVMHDRSGQFMRGFKGLNFLDSAERLSFWRLRQTIDATGVRYDFFLRHAMNWHIEAGWIRPPRPQHINANADMASDILLAWEEECATRIQFPKDPRYKAHNYMGHQDQIDWENWLVQQLKQRRHPQYALHAALYVEDALRIERALMEFDERVVTKAIDETITGVSQR